MIKYTHNFEFTINGIDVSGELAFHPGEHTCFKTTVGEEMTIVEHGNLQKIFEYLSDCYKSIGDIEKIEVVRK